MDIQCRVQYRCYIRFYTIMNLYTEAYTLVTLNKVLLMQCFIIIEIVSYFQEIF